MPNTDKLKLMQGTWFFFRDFAEGTTAQDVQDLFVSRTGVEIPLERIELTESTYDSGTKYGAVVSITKNQIAAILAWAFTDDKINGVPVRFHVARNDR